MPFSNFFTTNPIVERLIRLRRHRLAGHGLALAIVALATAVRLAVGPVTGLPYITYFPAITVIALIAGLWPAVLATLLSAALAWYLFIPAYDWGAANPHLFSVLFFLIMAAIIVGVVALLNAAMDRLIEQDRNIRQVIDAAPTGIVVVGEDGSIRLVNASAEKLFGYDRRELLGENVDKLVPETHAAEHGDLRRAFLANPSARPMGAGRDLSARRKNGSEFFAEIGLSPIVSGSRHSVLANVVDVTVRRGLQERERLLTRELQHRLGNVWVVIQSVVRRSLAGSAVGDETRAIVEGRLRALARATDALAGSDWKGVSLADLVRAEVEGFPAGVGIDGCDIVVRPEVAQQFALVVHELATNALKHGALSVAGGRVAISGAIEKGDAGDRYRFRWVEQGGPPVTAPARRGFGSVVLLESVKPFADFVTLDFDPEGVRYELLLLLAALAPRNLRADDEAPAPMAVV